MTTSSYQRSCRLINSVEAREWKKRPLSVKFADFLTSSFGTFSFLVFNILVFVLWMTINTGKLVFLSIPVFDPHPFFFLTMLVSLEAIFLSIIVLISQNRQSQIAKFRDELDLQINLIAEREITKVLKILKEMKGDNIKDEELEEMLVETNTSYIERQLEKQIFEKPASVVEEIMKLPRPYGRGIFSPRFVGPASQRGESGIPPKPRLAGRRGIKPVEKIERALKDKLSP